MDLVPFDQPEPEDGIRIELQVPNPRYAEEHAAYRAALEHNPFAVDDVLAAFSVTFSANVADVIGRDEICIASPKLTLVVGYPLRGEYGVAVDARTAQGFTRGELFEQIVRIYTAMYEGAVETPGPLKYQPRIESPRFSTAWHRLKHLAIEGVVIDPARGIA
jgi:hypothetical protein